MDLLRFDDITHGPVYADGRGAFCLIGDGATTKVSITYFGGTMQGLVVAGDVDEVAMSIETAIPEARIHRIG